MAPTYMFVIAALDLQACVGGGGGGGKGEW